MNLADFWKLATCSLNYIRIRLRRLQKSGQPSVTSLWLFLVSLLSMVLLLCRRWSCWWRKWSAALQVHSAQERPCGESWNAFLQASSYQVEQMCMLNHSYLKISSRIKFRLNIYFKYMGFLFISMICFWMEVIMQYYFFINWNFATFKDKTGMWL